MSEMLLLSVSIYLIDSILSGIYTREFLREKYRKRVVSAAWAAVWFFIQIVVFEILGSRFQVGKVQEMILNICVLLFMQSAFLQKDIQKQLFVAFSYMAGKETVKYMVSVINIALGGLCDKVLGHLATGETINTVEKALVWIKIFNVIFAVLCAMFYAFCQ